jgi:hypothetical protein
MKGLRRRPGTENPFYPANHFNFIQWTIGPSVAHVVNVAVTLLDPDGNPLKTPGSMTVYISSDPLGQVPATLGGVDSVMIGTNGALLAQVTNVAFDVISNPAGLFDLNITKAAGGTYYLNFIQPDGGVLTTPAIVIT